MAQIQWPLRYGRPMIEVSLGSGHSRAPSMRALLADTGAGHAQSRFELLLSENDCLMFGGIPLRPVKLGGAYVGSFRVYLIQVRIGPFAFDKAVRAVGVPSPPAGFDGIACFRFLTRFRYGNIADPRQFGLEI